MNAIDVEPGTRCIGFEMSCPRCAQTEFTVVNQRTNGYRRYGFSDEQVGTELEGIVECDGCGRQWELMVRLLGHVTEPDVAEATKRRTSRREVA